MQFVITGLFGGLAAYLAYAAHATIGWKAGFILVALFILYIWRASLGFPEDHLDS